MPTATEVLRDYYVGLLTPVVVGLTDGKVKSIETNYTFNSEEEAAIILDKFRTQAPVALLSFPDISFETTKSGARVLNGNFTYNLIVIFETRLSPAEIEARWHLFLANALEALTLKAGTQPRGFGNLDFARPLQFSTFQDVEGQGMARLVFQAELRNWKVNQLEG